VSLNDLGERDVETTDAAAPPLPPAPRLPAVRNPSITASTRSASPSSDVENILESLRDSTTTYYGDFTLRRVFSLEEELTTCRESGDSAGENNDETTTPIEANRSKEDQLKSVIQTTWTLPLVRRTSATAVEKSLSNAVSRINGFTRVRTPDVGDFCSRLRGKSGARVMVQNPSCPGNVSENPCVALSPRDIISDEKDGVLPLQAVCEGRTNDADALTGAEAEVASSQIYAVNAVHNDVVQTLDVEGCQKRDTSIKLATTDCDDLSCIESDSNSRQTVEHAESVSVGCETNQVRSSATSYSLAVLSEPEPELYGSHRSTPEVVSSLLRAIVVTCIILHIIFLVRDCSARPL